VIGLVNAPFFLHRHYFGHELEPAPALVEATSDACVPPQMSASLPAISFDRQPRIAGGISSAMIGEELEKRGLMPLEQPGESQPTGASAARAPFLQQQ
jgi:hypothetical protein